MKTRLIIACTLILSYQIGLADDFTEYDLDGFSEIRVGNRLQDDPNQKDQSVGEIRLQLETEEEVGDAEINLVADFVIDPVFDDYATDLETGEGFLDLRQANILLYPLDNVDVKFGRQILTWGTGDLIFINDLFAKDWNSFIIGRDDEYLKAPTDAIKISTYLDNFNFDIIYVPVFSADRYIDGKRVSFFDRVSNDHRGRENPLSVNKPDDAFNDDEIAIRIYQSIQSVEVAFYYYHGLWKSPGGLDITTGDALFPELEVYGLSVRGSLLSGIANIEIGQYKSNNSAKFNALSRNSEFRLLIGYEQEIATELTLALQYNLERMLDYGEYRNSLPSGALIDDENRSVATIRLTQLLMRQNLKLSLFNFYSPSENDGYLRLNLSYKMSDDLKVEVGMNQFYGRDDHTFYSQFENNSNAYTALRYEF